MKGDDAGTGLVFQLTVQSGAMPGATWVITPTPLLIGRSQTCHIVLSDALVSRTHCSVQRLGDGARLRDLGSSNPCLLNGKPVTNVALAAGDRLAVGDTIFLVSVIRPDARGELATPGKRDTLRLQANEAALLRTANAPEELQRLPKTARDYAALFQFGLDCATCADIASLCDRLTSWLLERFQCAVVGMHEPTGSAITCTYQSTAQCELPSEHVLATVVEDGCARLIQADDKAATRDAGNAAMICPLSIGGDVIGLLSVVAAGGDRHYQREDLEFLVSMAHVFSPYLRAVAERELLRSNNARLREQYPQFPRLIGKSPVIHALRRHLRQAAMAEELPVLLLGETGTGKELAAMQIHLGSSRAEHEFVCVNCAAIPDELFESEFFGHVRGAFTGASDTHGGLVSQAHKGTLFLDEIAELSPANQAKLLRFVELGKFRSVGDSRERHAEVRIIAATNQPLPNDSFRQDLYHRLSGFQIQLPSLRNRREDIELLAEYFREQFQLPAGPGRSGFTEDAIAAMRMHSWNGNVRELRQRVHRAVRVAQGTHITAEDVLGGEAVATSAETPEHLVSLAEVERAHIARVLLACKGDTQRAAEILEIARSTVYKKIGDYGLR